MSVDVDSVLRLYDLLSEPYGRDRAREILSQHIPTSISWAKTDDGTVVGTACYWQIADPYDTRPNNGPPAEVPFGKYVYLPHIYIRPENRGSTLASRVLKVLIDNTVKKCPGATHLAFRRERDKDPRLVHVVKVSDNGKN
jgi:hypothetical protein